MQGKTMLLLAAALVIALAAIPALAQNGVGFGQNNGYNQEQAYNGRNTGQYNQRYQGNAAMNGQRGHYRGHMNRYDQAGNWNHGQGMRQGRATGYGHRRGGGCPGWNY
ncbi:hypothetical protein [Desulfohalovibrio reitneri]|uniref:hypothetical protein n=1 Tax=Desulfohalovibrio reitneri TaxID=1307759 RepID=UPI0004A7459E|nr:hypothetical protein [Desulfohalovibrio reitneri]